METDFDINIYHMVQAISSYEELMMNLTIFNITGYEYLTERDFDYYYRDDWKWDQVAQAIAGNCVLPF